MKMDAELSFTPNPEGIHTQKTYPMPVFFADAIRRQLARNGDSKMLAPRPSPSAYVFYKEKKYFYCAGNLWLEGGPFWPNSDEPILAKSMNLPLQFFVNEKAWAESFKAEDR